MDRLKKRLMMFFFPLVLILFASVLAAQGPPGCYNACWQAYLDAVKTCPHGDAACLALAREAALKCVQGCGFPPSMQQQSSAATVAPPSSNAFGSTR